MGNLFVLIVRQILCKKLIIFVVWPECYGHCVGCYAVIEVDREAGRAAMACDCVILASLGPHLDNLLIVI